MPVTPTNIANACFRQEPELRIRAQKHPSVLFCMMQLAIRKASRWIKPYSDAVMPYKQHVNSGVSIVQTVPFKTLYWIFKTARAKTLPPTWKWVCINCFILHISLYVYTRLQSSWMGSQLQFSWCGKASQLRIMLATQLQGKGCMTMRSKLTIYVAVHPCD